MYVVVWVALLGLAAGSAWAQDSATPHLGYVSLDRILRDSVPAKAAQAKLDAEFSSRQKELADTAARLKPMYDYLEKNAAVISDSERARRQKELADQDKDFQRRQREFNEDVNQRKNEELAAVVEKANRVIKQIAEAEKYDMIFQEAVYVNPRVDITDKVLKVLNSQSSTSSSGTPSGAPPAPAAK
ncbi:MAG: OmpH family outer membrane protein [Burkholderiaceae bacterium]|jgi:outer membrane protein